MTHGKILSLDSIKWVAPCRWPFRPNFAMGSVEDTPQFIADHKVLSNLPPFELLPVERYLS